jgi:hypothetical protein
LSTEIENEEENLVTSRTRLQKTFISIGLTCLIISVGLLVSTAQMEPSSNEYLIITIFCGILFGCALFFEGYGYSVLPKVKIREIAYFGSPVLFQVIRVTYRIPYVLLCYNGWMIIGEINVELVGLYVILFLPFVFSQVSFRWTRLQNWIKSLDTVVYPIKD